jgi:hypothetical protein
MLPLLLVSMGLLCWWFLQPSISYLRGFGRVMDSASAPSFFDGLVPYTQSVSGLFNKRAVRLELRHPMEHQFGEIVVAMRTSAIGGEAWKDSTVTSRNPDLSRATFDLEGKYQLILTLSDGWLRATSSPRIGRRFPGAFDDGMWRKTLEQMDLLCRWMEEGQLPTPNTQLPTPKTL